MAHKKKSLETYLMILVYIWFVSEQFVSNFIQKR